ncbi:MAG: tRNA (N6-threonylcarbamoyladenosine(37)-N6)-methyltransferase TrmO [Hyphomicrobiales bacterium]|nr:tRNA (N6-threonylcarbamoyladenosine(37)-N6)-methyltransferase TrmO [Hyphomicrobiales bacterium]
MTEKREGEVELAIDPANLPADGHVVFIGHIRSPWISREECPKNMARARERGIPATVEVTSDYRPGLAGLEGASHVAILTWLDRSARNLIVQKPRHAPHPKGVFALRSPARPNPVGLHVARLTGVDIGAGILTLDAIDVLDGTPVIDIKPYYASTDSVPEATVARSEQNQQGE